MPSFVPDTLLTPTIAQDRTIDPMSRYWESWVNLGANEHPMMKRPNEREPPTLVIVILSNLTRVDCTLHLRRIFGKAFYCSIIFPTVSITLSSELSKR